MAIKKKDEVKKPNAPKPDLTRMTINLPTELVNRIEDYAVKFYVNRTTAMTILLNNALDTSKAIGDMNELVKFINNNQGIINKGEE